MHDLSTASEVQTFVSRAHPRSLPFGIVYGRAIVRPIAACMLPVMILTLVAVLEGLQIFPGVLWGTAAAFVAASAWTSFRLHRELAEIRIHSETACMRTVWDVLQDAPADWRPVLDVRDYGSWAHASVGDASFEIERDQWPEYREMISVFKRSAHAAYLPE